MAVQGESCDRQQLERFLADQLDGAELTTLEAHLETCPSCREGLEHLAAEGSWWDEARGFLSSPGPERGTVGWGMGRSEADGAADDLAPCRFGLEGYLAPTEDPHRLGRLGGYEVAGIVGCGGMGIVLKAFDPPLNRYVAIKVLGPQLALNGAARQRFAREAKAAATVVHDNVIAIHAVAEANGLPYFVMPYVSGPSLEKRLEQTGTLSVVEVLRIGMQIAKGLAAAHAQGLVHRDIKPANILLEQGVERVTITDFGLARAIGDVGLTQTGVVAGTPQYMSPEQARAEAVDHRSDLFSLGSVMYALCTGVAPFRGATSVAVLRQVSDQEPAPLRSLNPEVPAWLEAIVTRLMAKTPSDRLQNAAEVAVLLEGYLAHLRQPATVPAPPLPSAPAADVVCLPKVGWWTNAREQLQRQPRLAALGSVVCLVLAVVVLRLAALQGQVPPPPNNQPVDLQKWDAAAGPDVKKGKDATLRDAAPARGRVVWLTAFTILLCVIGLAFFTVWYRARRPRHRAATAGAAPPAPLVFGCAGCGKRLRVKAELAGKKIRCPQCSHAEVVPAEVVAGPPNPPAEAILTMTRWTVWLAALTVVTAAGLFLVLHLMPVEPDGPSYLGVKLGAEAMADIEDAGFHNDELAGDQPLRWTNGNARLVIPLRRGEVPRSLQVHLVALRPAGTQSARLQILLNQRSLFDDVIPLGAWDRTFDLDEVASCKAVTLELVSDTFTPGAADTRKLGVQVYGIRLLGTAEESARGSVSPGHALDPAVVVLDTEPALFTCAAIAFDGRTLASAGRDGAIHTWDVAAGRVLQTFKGPGPIPRALAMSLAGHIAVGGDDGSVQLVSMTGRPIATARAAGPPVTALSFSLDSGNLAIADGVPGGAGSLGIWSLSARKDRAPATPFDFPVRTAAYAPDGRSVAAIVQDGSAQIADLNGKVLTRLAPPLPARSIAYSSSMTRLAVADGDHGHVTIYSIALGRPVGEMQTPGNKTVTGMMFARDDRRLLTVDADGIAQLWDVTRSPARAVGSPRLLPKHVWFGLFLPDRFPAEVDSGATIRVWTVRKPAT